MSPLLKLAICSLFFTALLFSGLGTGQAWAYSQYTTHTRISAAALKMLEQVFPNGEYAEIYSTNMLDPDRFDHIHSNNDGSTGTNFYKSALDGFLQHPIALGDICEDEQNILDGCPTTNTVRSYMHFYPDEDGNGLEYYGYLKSRFDGPWYLGAWEAGKEFLGGEEASLNLAGNSLGIERIDYPRDFAVDLWETYPLPLPENNKLLSECKAKVPSFDFDLSNPLVAHWFESRRSSLQQSLCWPDAVDWAYNGAGSLFSYHRGMNWQGAINGYNWATEDGKKESLFRLGHTLHLLQDISVFEHKIRMAHPGGGFNGSELQEKVVDRESDVRQGLQRFIERYAEGHDSVRIGGTVDKAYQALIDEVNGFEENAKGYERFVSDRWTVPKFEEFLSSKGAKPQGMAWSDKDAFFNLFKSLKDTVILPTVTDQPSSTQSGGVAIYPAGGVKPYFNLGFNIDVPLDDPWLQLTFALGLEPVTIGNPSSAINLADTNVPAAIRHSAALIKYFFDVVDRPPYVDKVEIYQANALKYRSDWVDKFKPGEFSGYETMGTYLNSRYVDSRNFESDQIGPIYPDHQNQIKLLFKEGPVTQIARQPVVELRLNLPPAQIDEGSPNTLADDQIIGGFMPADTPLTINVKGSFYADLPTGGIVKVSKGSKWSGTFEIPRQWANHSFTINIAAQNVHKTFDKRNHDASFLDANPGTVPRTSLAYPYNWNGYEASQWDSKNIIQVGRVSPTSGIVPSDQASSSKEKTPDLTPKDNQSDRSK